MTVWSEVSVYVQNINCMSLVLLILVLSSNLTILIGSHLDDIARACFREVVRVVLIDWHFT